MIGIAVFKGGFVLENKKILAIINPTAGRTKSQRGTFDIVDVFSTLGCDFDIKTTTKRGDATEFAKEYGMNYDVILCCGGDGTLNETINGVMCLPERRPIGYVPTGSTCDLATTLGIPSEIRAAVELIISDKRNTYDIGNFNDRHFCYVASFGVGSSFSYTTPQKMKNVFGKAAYFIDPFLCHPRTLLAGLKPVHIKIEYDDGIIEDDFSFGAISNSTSVGGLITFDRSDVKLNDGMFELLLVRRVKGAADAFKLLGKIQKHNYDGEQIMFLHTKNLKMRFDKPTEWSLDGEFGGSPVDVDFSISYKGIELFSEDNDLFCK